MKGEVEEGRRRGEIKEGEDEWGVGKETRAADEEDEGRSGKGRVMREEVGERKKAKGRWE